MTAQPARREGRGNRAGKGRASRHTAGRGGRGRRRHPSVQRRGGNTLVAFSAATGTKEWSAAIPGTEVFDPVAVTGSVIQAVGVSQSGQGNPVLVSVDATTGKVLSTGQPRVLGPAPPARPTPSTAISRLGVMSTGSTGG
jgi:outer membrane protein assembly factor BamB